MQVLAKVAKRTDEFTGKENEVIVQEKVDGAVFKRDFGLAVILDLDQHVVEAANPLKKVMFERYNTSLQAFIDRGAALAG